VLGPGHDGARFVVTLPALEDSEPFGPLEGDRAAPGAFTPSPNA
jgi:hypothetical protein